MAYVEPSIVNLRIRFPEFAAVEESTLAMILDEAIGNVGSTWVEKDRATAILYLAAHLLATQVGIGGQAGSVAVTGNVKRRKVGDVEVEFAGVRGGAGESSSTDYSSTAYGQQYYRLMRRSFPGVSVV